MQQMVAGTKKKLDRLLVAWIGWLSISNNGPGAESIVDIHPRRLLTNNTSIARLPTHCLRSFRRWGMLKSTRIQLPSSEGGEYCPELA